MADRLALKRLTKSDLTFFESLFRKLGVGNQKSINLNADVFIREFYPSLPSLVGSVIADVIPLSLKLVGPNAAPPYVISRAITKRAAYKNWRLNGEFIRDPEDQPHRFDILKENDLALIEFHGDPAPQQVSLLLVAQGVATDASVYKPLASRISKKTMVSISRQDLANALAGVPLSHPVWAFAENPEFDAALEDAALGGIEGAELLTKKSKRVTAATLAAAKLSAEYNGREGEAVWPAPGSEDTKLGVLMEREVRHGASEIYAGIQA